MRSSTGSAWLLLVRDGFYLNCLLTFSKDVFSPTFCFLVLRSITVTIVCF